MKFEFLSGDSNWHIYGGKWVSPKLNGGDFDYWLVIELINWIDGVGETDFPFKYNASIWAVSPAKAGKRKLAEAFAACGIENAELQNDPLVQIEILHTCGIAVELWSQNGNGYRRLLAEARDRASYAGSLPGFYLDDGMAQRIQWDAIDRQEPSN